jgi:predicted nucleic acid-binding protein
MTKVFIDTNVLMDVLDKRGNLLDASLRILQLASKRDILAYISSLSVINANYICTKKDKTFSSSNLLDYLASLATIEPMDYLLLQNALSDNFLDFEDAVQHQTALHCKAECIITRNTKDFEKSRIPIFTPEQFLNIYF